jgi:hypothetical protein
MMTIQTSYERKKGDTPAVKISFPQSGAWNLCRWRRGKRRETHLQSRSAFRKTAHGTYAGGGEERSEKGQRKEEEAIEREPTCKTPQHHKENRVVQ